MQFAHGFHNVAVENNTPSTKWRVDPRKAGPSYVLGDIGTHPLYLAEVMLPDLKIKRVLCSRQSFVESRAPLEDNAMTLMEYDNGAAGYVWSCSSDEGKEIGFWYPDVHAGLEGVKWVEKCVESADNGSIWIDY